MNPANINQAMVNRANAQYEIKSINNRINDVVKRINGVDIVFRPNELISGSVISDLISGAGASVEWLSAALISNATVYEAPAPAQSSYINNLRPASMWTAHVTMNGQHIQDAYSPLESFVRSPNGSFMFNPLQRQIQVQEERSYGGNLPNMLMPLITGVDDENRMNVSMAILSNVLSSEYLNINNLYFIQNRDLISQNLSGAHAESFTLHFE